MVLPENNTPRDIVTRLLNAPRDESRASGQLLALVYDQLRKIAQQRMGNERRDHTLQATALVHEAYVRLVGDQDVQWQGRAHFFAAAADAMRKLLIEHARARGRIKRGGGNAGRRRVPLGMVDLAADGDPEEILALDEAIRRLEAEEPELAELVRLRFFAGLSVEETAAVLAVSPRTVNQNWTYARARLYRLIAGKAESPPPP